MYSDLYLQEKSAFKIPKVFLVAVVAVMALITSQVYISYSSVPTKASNINVTKHFVVNRTSESAQIFVETEEPINLYMIWGEGNNKLTNTSYSDSDSARSQTPGKYHVFELNKLQPNGKYWYQLLTDRKMLEISGNTIFDVVTSGDDLRVSARGNKNPVYGKVTSPNGQGLSGALVVVSRLDPSVSENQKERFLVRSSDLGEWLYSLPSSYSLSDKIAIEIFHEKYPKSTIKALVSRSGPLPQTTIIGTDYDFTQEAEKVLGETSERRVASNANDYVISILYPEKNAIIPDSKPLLKGYGIPKTTVSIEVNSKPVFKAQTTVNPQGIWMVEPKNPFFPGSYTATFKILDNTGAVRNLTRSFVIAKSGEQVLGESTISTPSGTLSPTRSLSGTVSPTQGNPFAPTNTPTGGIPVTPIATQAPIVTIITATPVVLVPTNLTPTSSTLKTAGSEFPNWLPLTGGVFILAGYLFVREASKYT
ncbi:MAG: Ig-like domain-containing protein [Patescibacteria group bacterium]